jgi:HK97 family phage major capsid protein
MGPVDELTLRALGNAYGIDVAELLDRGGTPGQAKDLIENAILQRHTRRPSGGFTADLTRRERNNYSIVAALNYLTAKAEGRTPDDTLESELSRDIAKKTGRITAGLLVPLRLYAAGLTTSPSVAGGYTIATELQDVVEYLRAKLKVALLGATILHDLQNQVAFPVEASVSTPTWQTENPGSDAADSDGSFGQRTMTPHGLIVTTSVSRSLLQQASTDIEAFVRRSLALSIATAIDGACVAGTGTQGQPVGLLRQAGVGSVVGGTNGAMITSAAMSDLAGAVVDASGDTDVSGYLTSVAVRNKLVKTGALDQSSTGIPAWTAGSDGVGRVGGFRAEASKNVPSNLTKGTAVGVCSAVVFSGNWADLIVGDWGYFVLDVDPFRLKKQGMTELTATTFVDILIRHSGSFAVMADALTA